MSGFLTTHVLDTALGMPARQLRISLYRLADGKMSLLNELITNDDGRTDSPILDKQDFAIGVYQLVFHAGPYLDATHKGLPEPKFLDEIPLQFAIADASSHYHVPLLLSPYGYSTYRGS